MNTCVAWLLLFTYVVLLTVGGVGIWLAVSDILFLSSSKPLNNVRYGDYEENGETTYTNDPRLYLLVPTGVSCMIAGVLIMAGMCSRKIFTTTVALYSSLGLWILNLLIVIMYQSVPIWHATSHDASALLWVLGFQIGILILLAIQVIIAMWELRRQKANWPVINFSNIFTLSTVLVVTKMVLSVYTANNFYYSQMMWSLMRIHPDQQLNVPASFVFPCAVGCAYGLIVSFEGVASHFFGQMHNRMMACTTLISAICYGVLGVFASPAFISVVVGIPRLDTDVLIFASIMSALNFIHALTCMVFPSALTTPPKHLRVIVDNLQSIILSSPDPDMNQMPRETIFSSRNQVTNAVVSLRNKLSASDTLIINTFSTVVSLLAIILICSDMYGPRSADWSSILMLAGDVAIFSRTMPLSLTELVNKTLTPIPFLQQTVSYILENSLLFPGAIGVFCKGYPSCHVAAGVFNIMFVFFQVVLIKRNCSQMCKMISSGSRETEGPEMAQPFAAEGPEDAEVVKDEIQDGGSYFA